MPKGGQDEASLRSALHEAKHQIQHKTASINRLESQLQNLEKQLKACRVSLSANSSNPNTPNSSTGSNRSNASSASRNGKTTPSRALSPVSSPSIRQDGFNSDTSESSSNISLAPKSIKGGNGNGREVFESTASINASAIASLSGGSGKVIGELHKEIEDLKAVIEQNKKQIAQERRLKEQALDQLMDARESKDSYRIESENMRIMMDRKERGMEEERAKRIRAEKEVADLRDYAMSSGRRAEELAAQVAGMEAKREQYEAQYETLRRSAHDDMTQLKRGLEQSWLDRQRQVERVRALETERASNQKRLEGMQEKYLTLQEQFTTRFEQEFIQLRRDLQDSIKENESYRQRTAECESEVKRLTTRIRQYREA